MASKNGNRNTNGQPHQEEASEVTPLLASSPVAPSQDADIAKALVGTPAQSPRTTASSTHTADAKTDDDKPLPKMQIFLLCYARFIEPVAFFSIFPFINQMLQFNGHLPAADVGFYSGLIESLFSLTQMCVMILWGWASDRVGRKPVLVSSLAGIAIATSIFGMAKTVWQMILFRCLAGVFAGNVVTIRTMITEHSTSKTQARAFSWFAFAGNVGILTGPLIGGALAEPAKQYPGMFGNIEFFQQYPYALPTVVVGAIGLMAVLTLAFFLKETLQRKSKGIDAEGDNVVKPVLMSTWDLLQVRGVGIVLYVYAHTFLLAFSYTALVPVFWFTPVKLGGFGFSTVQMSLFMTLTGLSQAIWLLVIFPPLQHRIGTNGVMRLCGNAYPIFMALLPMLNLLLRSETAAATRTFWIALPIILTIGPGISMAFTAVQLSLNDVSPSPETLGTLNALALTGMSALRSFTPWLFTTIFAVGVRRQILGGYLVWAIMVLIAAAYTVATRYLPEASERDYPAYGESEDREE